MLKNLNIAIIVGFLSLTGCAREIDVTTSENKPIVTIPPRPREIQTAPVSVSVITKQNINDLTAEIAKNPTSVFIVLLPQDYESLVNNIGELRRYLTQQTTIIEYYETTIKSLSKQQEKK